MYVNLFSESLQRRVLVDRRASQWMKVWAVAFVVAAVVALAHWPRMRAVHSELKLAELRAAPVAERLARSERLKAELAQISEARLKLRSLAPDSAPLGVLGLISEATRSANNNIQIRSVNYTATKNAPPTTKDANPLSRGSIVVHGLAADEAAAAHFVEHLRLSPRLRHVELKSSSRATTSKPAIQFDVVCDL